MRRYKDLFLYYTDAKMLYLGNWCLDLFSWSRYVLLLNVSVGSPSSGFMVFHEWSLVLGGCNSIWEGGGQWAGQRAGRRVLRCRSGARGLAHRSQSRRTRQSQRAYRHHQAPDPDVVIATITYYT